MQSQTIDIPIKKKFEADPLLSFIVPIYNIETATLKRCLMSLDEQDYQNMEVICVFDGENKELLRIATQFLHKGKFKILEIEHGGACKARNAGFNMSKGEIVSFFNSDYIAKPGMAKMWVDALKANKDCGFVYGGYEYATNQRWVYPSKPFDPFVLQVANYIDCGFPLWRRFVVSWDENCKSLQDWDFWIRVIKTHNIKGHYLGRDFSFIAEAPRPKGLSEDSANNWADRVHYVKRKNNIPERDILVTSLGAPNHGLEIAKMIGADFRDDTWNKPNNYKALYMIGFYMKPDDVSNDHPKMISWYKDRGCKIIVHFVGADIYWLRKFSYENLKYLSGSLKLSCDAILCENEAAQEELKEFGINADIVPIPSYNDNWVVKPLPDDFTVSMFLVEPGRGRGESDFDKYCYEHHLSIVRAMPDIKFTAYGHGGKDVRYGNLKHYGIVQRGNWPEYVEKNSMLLRLCKHDTMPMASNEFVMAGRDVVTNIPAPCMNVIDCSGDHKLNQWDKYGEGLVNAYRWPDTKKKIIQTIRRIKKQHYDLKDKENASLYYRHLLDKSKYIQTINELAGTTYQEAPEVTLKQVAHA